MQEEMTLKDTLDSKKFKRHRFAITMGFLSSSAISLIVLAIWMCQRIIYKEGESKESKSNAFTVLIAIVSSKLNRNFYLP
jgi:hypothetical protein